MLKALLPYVVPAITGFVSWVFAFFYSAGTQAINKSQSAAISAEANKNEIFRNRVTAWGKYVMIGLAVLAAWFLFGKPRQLKTALKIPKSLVIGLLYLSLCEKQGLCLDYMGQAASVSSSLG